MRETGFFDGIRKSRRTGGKKAHQHQRPSPPPPPPRPQLPSCGNLSLIDRKFLRASTCEIFQISLLNRLELDTTRRFVIRAPRSPRPGVLLSRETGPNIWAGNEHDSLSLSLCWHGTLPRDHTGRFEMKPRERSRKYGKRSTRSRRVN